MRALASLVNAWVNIHMDQREVIDLTYAGNGHSLTLLIWVNIRWTWGCAYGESKEIAADTDIGKTVGT